MEKLDTLAGRMKAARKRAKVTLEQVGALFGITPQAVHHWENPKDKTTPSPEQLVDISRLIKVNLIWLLTGNGDPYYSSAGAAEGETAEEGRIVPMKQLAGGVKYLREPGQDPIANEGQRTVRTQFPCSERSFVVALEDDSMAPDFLVGDRVVIDPDAKYTPGCYVLAVIDERPVFHRFVPKIYERDKPSQYDLVPTNEQWPTISVDESVEATLVGVMTEHTRPYRNS